MGFKVKGFDVVGFEVMGGNVMGFNVAGFNVVGFHVVGLVRQASTLTSVLENNRQHYIILENEISDLVKETQIQFDYLLLLLHRMLCNRCFDVYLCKVYVNNMIT
jgi:6-phosphogluconate dehydrogenase